MMARGNFEVITKEYLWRTILGALVLPCQIILIAYPFFQYGLESLFSITGIAFALFVAPQIVVPNNLAFFYKYIAPIACIVTIFLTSALLFEWIY